MGLSQGEPISLSRLSIRPSAPPTSRQGLSENIPPKGKSIFSRTARLPSGDGDTAAAFAQRVGAERHILNRLRPL
jgi:hypothetical protein